MTIYSILATTAIQQACDLFRDKSNKKDQHGCRKQQAAHVRKPVLGEVGVDVIAKACRKKSQAGLNQQDFTGNFSNSKKYPVSPDRTSIRAIVRKTNSAGVRPVISMSGVEA